MMEPETPEHVFPTAKDDFGAAKLVPETPQTGSHSYRLAYTDRDFLLRDELSRSIELLGIYNWKQCR